MIAGLVHVGRSTARPAVNLRTAGLGAPIVSTAEDVSSLGLSLIAIFVPLLVVVALIVLAGVLWKFARRVRSFPEGGGMPSTSRAGPAFLGSRWEKVIAFVVLVAGALLVLQWWTGRQPSGPARPGMAPASVVHQGAVHDGETELTIRYRVDGKTYDVTKPVAAAAFRTQGKVAWACYAPGDPADASIRLPEDPLCGQQ